MTSARQATATVTASLPPTLTRSDWGEGQLLTVAHEIETTTLHPFFFHIQIHIHLGITFRITANRIISLL